MSEPIEQHVAAFRVWCTDGEQDTAKTAEITGMNRRNIQFWMKRDDWRGQWLAQGAPEAERAAQQGKQMLRYAMPVVARRLLAIVGAQDVQRNPITGQALRDANGEPLMGWASSDKDAVNAAKLIALYGWGSPLSSTDTSDGSVLLGSYTIAEAGENGGREAGDGEESVAELRARASRMLEATVQSVNTRTTSASRRGKRV